MPKSPINVQDHFLNLARREKVPVVIHLVPDKEIQGIIRSFDNFSLVLENEKQYLVYKHAIVTISPVKENTKIYHGIKAND